MNANIELIGTKLGFRPPNPSISPQGSNRLRMLAGQVIDASCGLIRRWAMPAVLSPHWWTAARSSKIELDAPEFVQHSILLHEITRRL